MQKPSKEHGNCWHVQKSNVKKSKMISNGVPQADIPHVDLGILYRRHETPRMTETLETPRTIETPEVMTLTQEWDDHIHSRLQEFAEIVGTEVGHLNSKIKHFTDQVDALRTELDRRNVTPIRGNNNVA